MEPITCSFVTDQALYAAYMPFVQGGGLFIRIKPGVDMPVNLGDLVELSVTLPDTKESDRIAGKVVWITPIGSQGSHPAGYGVALLEQAGENLKKKIVKRLSSLQKEAPTSTDTM